MKKQWEKGDIVGSSDFNRYEQSNKEVFGKTENHITDFNNPHKVTKSNIGLENVDNTSDLDKPVSRSLQAELDKKLTKEELSSHTTQEAVISQGVHGVRYFDKKLQVFVDGNWIDIIDDLPAIRVKVFAETGTVVTATKGETVIKGTTVDGFVFLKLTDYGYWDIQGINPGGEVSTDQTINININIMKDYEITLEFYKADFNIKTDKGALISCVYNGQVIEQQTSDGINNKFTVKKKGLYTFYAEYANARSGTIIKEAVAGIIIYNITLNFCKLEITVETGSNVVATLDTYRLEQVSVGEKVLFYLPKLGFWATTATRNDKTATDTFYCNTYSFFQKKMTYNYKYTITIDETISNPANMITYSDDATGMGTGWDNWKDKPFFKDIKPCLLKEGKVIGYLQRDDFTKFEDGSSADITTGAMGDVMIEFPVCIFNIIADYDKKTITLNTKSSVGGTVGPFLKRGGAVAAKALYISAFIADDYLNDGKLRSLFNKNYATTSSELEQVFRDKAVANYSGYFLYHWWVHWLLQVLFMIIYKTTDIKRSLGIGLSYRSTFTITGISLKNKFCSGSITDNTVPVKFLGLENFFGGNRNYFVDGAVVERYNYDGFKLYREIDPNKFNSDGTNYSLTTSYTMKATEYVSSMNINAIFYGVFLRYPNPVSASSTTYYTSYQKLDGSYTTLYDVKYPVCYYTDTNRGIFDLEAFSSKFIGGNTNARTAVRLCYCI